MPPATSEKQRRFFGAELARAKAGKKTETGMTAEKLADYASKPVKPSTGRGHSDASGYTRKSKRY